MLKTHKMDPGFSITHLVIGGIPVHFGEISWNKVRFVFNRVVVSPDSRLLADPTTFDLPFTDIKSGAYFRGKGDGLTILDKYYYCFAIEGDRRGIIRSQLEKYTESSYLKQFRGEYEHFIGIVATNGPPSEWPFKLLEQNDAMAWSKSCPGAVCTKLVSATKLFESPMIYELQVDLIYSLAGIHTARDKDQEVSTKSQQPVRTNTKTISKVVQSCYQRLSDVAPSNLMFTYDLVLSRPGSAPIFHVRGRRTKGSGVIFPKVVDSFLK